MTMYTYNPNEFLDDNVRQLVEQIAPETCVEWGGDWIDGTCRVRSVPHLGHATKSVVRSGVDAAEAFHYYTGFSDHVLKTWSKDSDTVVLLPCGSTKPIGVSAIHRKKLHALRRAGYRPQHDLAVVSEPCTIIPHDMRLSLPAVNYDFPPEFTDPDDYPKVFEVFTDRLAEWIDGTGYDRIVDYLIKGHREKLDAALEKCDSEPEVIRVPGSSIGLDSGKVCGDLFRSVDDIAAKLRFVRAWELGEMYKVPFGYGHRVTAHYVEVLGHGD